jgi:hypothetical protein
LPLVLNYLSDASPQTRGMAAWCTGQLGSVQALPALQKLGDDSTQFRIFLDDKMYEYRVGDLANNVFKTMNYSRGKPRGIENQNTKSETRQAAGYSTQIGK